MNWEKQEFPPDVVKVCQANHRFKLQVLWQAELQDSRETHMYQAEWGLAKAPFPSGLDPHLFFEGVNQREVLARLRFLAEHQRRLGLLLGQAGLGKSLILQIFARECRRRGSAVAVIDVLGLSAREFFWQVGQQLDASVKMEDDPVRLFRQLTDRMYENQLQEKQTVLLIDDVDQAGPELQTHLLRLAQLEVADPSNHTIILAANELHSTRLSAGLLELVDLRIDLEPWDELDTIGYLQLALVEAGSERPLFSDGALNELHRLAEGVPRKINRLADFSLMAGLQTPGELIAVETVRAAHQSLSLPRGC